jgi:hypothetical protein
MCESHRPRDDVTQNRFCEWTKHGAQQKATSLGSFSWEVVSHGYAYFASHFMDEVFYSLDYFDSCLQADPKSEDDCSGHKHAFSLETSDGRVHTACPRRMSITLRHGRLPNTSGAASDWFIDQNSPAVQLVVSEDSRHTTSQLGLRRTPTFYPARGQDIDSIGSILAIEHLDSIFEYLGHRWEILIDLAVAHSRNLVGLRRGFNESTICETEQIWLMLAALPNTHRKSVYTCNLTTTHRRRNSGQPPRTG